VKHAAEAPLPLVLPSPLCPGRSSQGQSKGAVRSRRASTGCRLLLLWQLIWTALLCCLLAFTLRPLQLQLRDSIRALDAALTRETSARPPQPPLPPSEPSAASAISNSLDPAQHDHARHSLPRSSASGPRIRQPSSPAPSFWLLPVAAAETRE